VKRAVEDEDIIVLILAAMLRRIYATNVCPKAGDL
jgi:hypothetical protein